MAKPQLGHGENREMQGRRMTRESKTTTYWRLSLVLSLFVSISSASANDIERFELANGLRVILQPIPSTDKIALVTLFDVGEDDDPAGKSGLGHFVEHVYVSASAGRFTQQSIDALIQRYGPSWNAQTGADYTIIANAFVKEKLDEELAEAAARMSDLTITQADIDRERPRILEELENMFGGMPRIAIANFAREAVRPTLNGGRRGGLPDHIKSIDLEAVRDHWKKFYKPINARLVLSGNFDVEETKNLIRKHFEKLPSGEKLPERPKREPLATKDPATTPPTENTATPEATPAPCEVKTHTIKPKVPGPKSFAAIAFPAPGPDSEHYAAFLVLVSRLWTRSNNAGFECRVQYTPLDDPVYIAIVAPIDESTNATDVLAKLDSFMKDAIKPPLSPGETEMTKKNFAMFLGTSPIPSHIIAGNLYGAAFGHGRRDQMGIDPATLKTALEQCKDTDLNRFRDRTFADVQQLVVVTELR